MLATMLALHAAMLQAGPAPVGAPAGFAERFDQLVAYLDQEALTPLETAEATLLATQVFGTGTQAMPYVRSRFMTAATPGAGGLAGVFLVCHGGEPERKLIRRQAETDIKKRKWIWNQVASEQRLFDAIEQGAQWRTATRLLPSATKCRQLALLCMESPDLLTRRAGLYWGYWVADDAHWNKVRTLAQNDPDKTTRQMAARLWSQHVAAQKR